MIDTGQHCDGTSCMVLICALGRANQWQIAQVLVTAAYGHLPLLAALSLPPVEDTGLDGNAKQLLQQLQGRVRRARSASEHGPPGALATDRSF
jgi:hypothetical protein